MSPKPGKPGTDDATLWTACSRRLTALCWTCAAPRVALNLALGPALIRSKLTRRTTHLDQVWDEVWDHGLPT